MLEPPLPGQATAGQGRKPRSGGAERASLEDGMALSGLFASKQTRLSFRSQPQPLRPPKRPVHIASRHRDAGDVAADMLFEGGAPGDEAESEPVVDHGEPAAG